LENWRDHGIKAPVTSCRHWLMALLVILAPLENATARCAATPHHQGAAGASVAADVMLVETATTSDRQHPCCSHRGLGDGERSCNVHCLPVTALIHAPEAASPMTPRTGALPSTSTLAASALASPDLRPPIPS
jgi:hypothetical protein